MIVDKMEGTDMRSLKGSCAMTHGALFLALFIPMATLALFGTSAPGDMVSKVAIGVLSILLATGPRLLR